MSSMNSGAAVLDPLGLRFDTGAGRSRPLPEDVAGSTSAHVAGSAVLSVRDVSLSFGGVHALADVDLVVSQGEIRAVIGPNGAGKSSLLNVVSGIYRPDTGQVGLVGQSFAHVPTDRLASLGVARTFQNLALFKGLSVVENVMMGLTWTVRSGFVGQILGTPRARREERLNRDRAHEVIDFFHLWELADRPACSLPYGLQKRVELARAVAPA